MTAAELIGISELSLSESDLRQKHGEGGEPLQKKMFNATKNEAIRWISRWVQNQIYSQGFHVIPFTLHIPIPIGSG